MKVTIEGNYLVHDLVVVIQHLAAQLDELGVSAVEGVSVELRPMRANGGRLTLADDAGAVDHLTLSIADLARPVVGSGTLKAIEMAAPQRRPKRSGPARGRRWQQR